MHVNSEKILRPLRYLKMRMARFGSEQKGADDELPLRGELFTTDHMKLHGQALADSHELSSERASNRLIRRLTENESLLIDARNLLTVSAKANHRIAPAGEWLLDNFYLIEEQIRTARRHFPKGYSRELPRLQNGPSAGLPRVYDIALEIISHGDGRVDPENLSNFVAAYQSVTPLKLGELWAIPIMLRLALIENLRRVAARITADRINRNLAGHWAEMMTEIVGQDPKSLILTVADMARSSPPMVSAFVAELTRRIQGQGPALALPLTWIKQRLSESGQTIEQLVRAENQQQAADQVSMSNSIGSLRFLISMDWREFVETMSIVEQILKKDPSDVYAKMDFATRDRYRHVVEEVAKSSGRSESEVAHQAIHLAQERTSGKDGDERSLHVGFYLVDEGARQLEGTTYAPRSPLEAFRRFSRGFPLIFYLGTILFITAAFTMILLAATDVMEFQNGVVALISLLLFLGASQLGVALTNWLVTLLLTPHLLPRMDFSSGIPSESRTLAVIPTMLTSVQNIEDLVESLEVRFLANRDEHLHFGLLTDFSDASVETLPEDELLLRLAQKKIEALNEKYRRSTADAFFLFNRPRRFSPQEQIWMGYERKRGKLEDLNALLRGGATDRFSSIVGDIKVLSNVKYVITLDTDTQLPRDAARQFAAAMAHPLNRAQYNADRQLIDKGYGILQPRVAVSLSGMNRSRYLRLCGSEPGIDPYTRMVSDVYQDLFGEGSYIGKGIYDVDAFKQVLKGRFPENRILSHDLLEGCYMRAGLLSDVLLYEEYPSRYNADVSRRYRWIRGDWQIVRWLFPSVPGFQKGRQKNPLSGVSRWKIFDNLRRSLVSAALTVLLLLAWIILTPAWLWTIAVIGTILIPPAMTALLDLCKKPGDVRIRQHMAVMVRTVAQNAAQGAFTLICLPYEAFFSLGAILRTVFRMWVSRKRLLEWHLPNEADRQSHASLSASWRAMWFAPFLSVSAGILIAVFRPAALGIAGPFLALWLASPAITWWLSRPLGDRQIRLTGDQNLFLRELARKTWAFFETFVGPEDHWLPPDNHQEHPVAVTAHRTSPTNMGLALLANLSAYDFGYVTAGRLLYRTTQALNTMQGLDRHQGHFYNWYDTQSLKPLAPLYISSVDSGNLAGHLLTLRAGFLGLADDKILGALFFDGLSDTLGIIADAVAVSNESYAQAQLKRVQQDLASVTLTQPVTLKALRLCLNLLTASAGELVAIIDLSDTDPESQLSWWSRAFAGQCQDAVDELETLTPWAALLPFQEGLADFPMLDRIPTLREVSMLVETFSSAIASQPDADVSFGKSASIGKLKRLITRAAGNAAERIAAIEALAGLCSTLARMDYDFLYDEKRHLLAIGYNVGERRRDESYYDLLASEARFATFVAIAQGQLPQESWFALGRLLTIAGKEPILLSWSGSMFEYLMPLLVMPTYASTLLDQSCKAVVARQIAYGKKSAVPWGISECGYNAIDVNLNYQYRAFGVPGLGLKRGLTEDLVIAPYASALALMVAPEAACLNLQRLDTEGFSGRYGFFEAIDYTPSRLPRGQSHVLIRSFMAHHQGMSLLSLAHLLLDRPMQKRFVSDPLFQATLLLLQERVPKATAFYAHTTELSEHHAGSDAPETPIRVFSSPATSNPEVQLLSNGRYHLMVTNAGGGYSCWKDLALTRWREDRTCDNWGTFCYLRDVTSGDFWSTAYQPALKQSETYETIFSEGRAEFRCRRSDFNTHTEIAVSPEDDIELRRVRITNRTRTARAIEVTSYAEVVLAPAISDILHPAFSNLFVRTEIIPDQQAILCTRRPRSPDEPTPWMFHLMAVHGADIVEVSYETDRLRFIGRGNNAADPAAMRDPAALSNSEGSVLDPIVAIRYHITLAPEETATINIVSGVAESRDNALVLLEKYQDRRLADRVFDLAWTHSQVLLRQLNVSEADAQLFGRLAGSIIYSNALLRADPGVLLKNNRGQSGLWGYAISGDLPILLLQIENPANIDLVRQIIQAHAYWRLKGLAVDLVIWNEDHAGYRQLLHDQIMGLIAAGTEANLTDRPGGIFVRPVDQISEEDRILIQTVARAVITDSRGTLADQIKRPGGVERVMPLLEPTRTHRPGPLSVMPMPRHDLTFFNGMGGFTPDGREYVITTAHGQVTPAPWVNVLANPYLWHRYFRERACLYLE